MNAEWSEEPQPQPQTKAGSAGALMKAQREALGWSIEQAAEQLKLAPRQVTALEEGDYASLPNPAVVRGFIRAYAKILKIDAAPLVATIDIAPEGAPETRPVRARSTTFSESRFPTLTQRSPSKAPWIVGAVVVLAVALGGAIELGYVSPKALMHGASVASAPGDKTPDTAAIPTVTTPATDAAASAPAAAATLQSPSVPLISVPGDGAPAAPAAGTTPAAGSTAPATPSTTVEPVAVATAPAPAEKAPAAGAGAGGNALVLTVTQDSWIEIRRKQGAPLISRIVLAGSTETFELAEPVLLVVGKPAGVEATLRGAAVPLKPVSNGTIARVNLK